MLTSTFAKIVVFTQFLILYVAWVIENDQPLNALKIAFTKEQALRTSDETLILILLCCHFLLIAHMTVTSKTVRKIMNRLDKYS